MVRETISVLKVSNVGNCKFKIVSFVADDRQEVTVWIVRTTPVSLSAAR